MICMIVVKQRKPTRYMKTLWSLSSNMLLWDAMIDLKIGARYVQQYCFNFSVSAGRIACFLFFVCCLVLIRKYCCLLLTVCC